VQCHVECQIVDPVTGRVQPRGAQGELRARGYGRMLGYWNDPEATRAAIDGAGWMHTGDLAVMRDDGYVSIVGRLKDIIIRGGENIAASEIEQVLHAHPKIREAYVIGVPDRHYGEELCACVRLLDRQVATPEELRQHCRRHLAVHKIPLYVYVVSELPLTASGKVQKFRLREQAIAWLGLQPAATVAAPASSATSS
jgi:fatty-acyl-CoA synthase